MWRVAAVFVVEDFWTNFIETASMWTFSGLVRFPRLPISCAKPRKPCRPLLRMLVTIEHLACVAWIVQFCNFVSLTPKIWHEGDAVESVKSAGRKWPQCDCVVLHDEQVFRDPRNVRFVCWYCRLLASSVKMWPPSISRRVAANLSSGESPRGSQLLTEKTWLGSTLLTSLEACSPPHLLREIFEQP